MITPSYGLTATERVLPNFVLDWTTGLAQDGVDVARAGAATFIGSDGLIQSASADTQRIDYSTGAAGLLIENSRVNLLLNSETLSTQIAMVSAVAYTFSFYGTGEVVLSGAHSAIVTGTGAYPTRTTLTFTPTAGALTLTVSGTVEFAQLEAGAFPTSYIPTTTAAVTRNADVATVTGTNFSDFYNAAEGAFAVQCSTYNISATRTIAAVKDSGTSDYLLMRILSAGRASARVLDGGVEQSAFSINSIYANNVAATLALAYKADNTNIAASATLSVDDTSGTIPTVDRLEIGSFVGVNSLNGHISKLMYWPQRLTNAEIQAFSK
jgi:hypothetical protein